MSIKVVLSPPMSPLAAQQIQELGIDVEIVLLDGQGATDQDISNAQVFLRGFSSAEVFNALIERMPDLRWLHIPRAGIDSSLVPAVMERDFTITNSAGVHAVPISEFVLMYMLYHAKHVADLIRFQSEQVWGQRQVQLTELDGKTIFIIGLGQIGQAIAARAKAFGMRVLGSRRSAAPTPNVDQVVGDAAWRSFLPEADYVVIAAPLTPFTRGMFGAAEFAMMRPDAYLINIARGEITDEEALVAALRNGQIAGAAVDVFSQEPLPAESPLWAAPNIFVTPHISWSSPEIQRRTASLFIDNLQRFLQGQPLRNIVDKEAGY